MFYFDEKKYNFWSVYNCIRQFYPIDVPEGMDSFYNSYPGLKERGKILLENIYDSGIFKEKWLDFCDEMSNDSSQKIVGTTMAISSCYSSFMEIEKESVSNLTRKKEIHFFVSLLGPFYTVMGLDENEINIGNNFYRSTNFLIVSPEKEYKDWFIYIEKHIEKQFEKYRFVPFSICRQILNGLSLKYKDNNCTVFDALFKNSLDMNARSIGDNNYKSWQWSAEKEPNSEKWIISKPGSSI